MKELSIEEKAKRYDEALEWMRDLYPSMTGAMKEDAEHYFPGIAESEDEKCCRQLIAHIQRADALSEDKKSYFLNWIEQHKEACTPKNGVYPEADGVRIWHDGHTFKVPFDWDKGKHALLTQEGYERSKKDIDDLQDEADALQDWDFVTATEKIKKLGMDIPLGENEYLPTAPVYLAMYKYRKLLNEALREAGAKEIDFSEDAWFAQRFDVGFAWSFFGVNRTVDYYGVSDVYAYIAVKP